MHKPIKSAVAALILVAVSARAEQVPLPYQAPAESGNQWMVFQQGQLQQQGNSPTFAAAGTITLDGRALQPNNQAATLDEKTRELILTFNTRPPSLRVTRRIKFDETSGVARIVDVIENTQDREVTARVMLMTNLNFGINSAQTLEDPKNKKSQLGWVADVSNGRGAMSLFAGKGSKVTPTIQYQQGNNQANAQMTIKVPAKDKVAIVHWHGGFDNSAEATKWIEQARESRLLADLPADVRKALINIGNTGNTLGNFELLRGDLSDVVELRGGDQLRGKVKFESYTLDTAFGAIELPADKILGVMSVGEFKPRQVLITTAGEIFGGTLKSDAVPVELPSGRSTQVPLSQISRIGFASGGVEAVEEFDLSRPMLFLRSGERCLIEAPTEPIEFVTRLGTLKLMPQQVALVVLKTATGQQEIYLADGSRLVGVLPRQTWGFKLSTASGAGVEIPTAAIDRVQLQKLAEDVGMNEPTLALIGGDVIATRLTGKLQLTTTFDTLEIDAAEVRSITRPDESAPDVQLTTADQTTLRGTLGTQNLMAKVAGDVTLEVPTASLREYANPKPFPGAALVQQAREVVKELDADDWKAREAAETKLAAFGGVVLPVLEEAAASQSPEAQQRLQTVIARLRKDQPPAASKLPAAPPME